MDAGRPRRNTGFTAKQSDQFFGSLATNWSGLILAGKKDKKIDLQSQGAHACAARATMTDGTVINGKFESEGCHAEMDVLEKVVARRYQLQEISKIEIEKQPCPRCAVILNVLSLNEKVTYKKVGQKDYPTWRFPDLGNTVNWIVRLNIHTAPEKSQEELLFKFRTSKWWD